MASLCTDHALLLGRTPFGESSLVVQVLTKRTSRAHIMARGAYRPTSGYCGTLDLFDTLELDWRPRDAGGLGELRGARILVRRRSIVASLATYRAALSVLELLDLAARPGQPEAGMFRLAESALDQLDTLGAQERAAAEGTEAAARIDLVRIAFDLGFLNELGLAPALDRCAACGREAPPPGSGAPRTHFAPAQGGRLCRRCAEGARTLGAPVLEVESTVLEAGALLLAHGPDARSQTAPPSGTLSTAQRQRLAKLVEDFLEQHLEQRPRSRARSHPPGPRGHGARSPVLPPPSAHPTARP